MTTAHIKICGVCDPTIAAQAVELGVHYIGIMCYKKSKRYVDPEKGREIARAVKTRGGIPVAVFVDDNAETMYSLCDFMAVNVVQLHGSVARATHHELPDDFQRIYVLQVAADGTLQADKDQGLFRLLFTRDLLLYDSLQGGSGQGFQLENFMNPFPMPFFLAGGLSPANVAAAIRAVRPYAVDVSSGVETVPGIKDIRKIRDFIHAVREVN